jgi:CubicO group peptidase (beta-lactamase class C family)
MKTRFGHSALVLVFALVVSSCATTGEYDSVPAQIAEQFLETSGVSGLAISVGTADQIIWSQGFGYADLEQDVPVDPSVTKFRVGSTAKPMTAVAVGQLYENGRLDLDAPIQTYLPAFPQKSGTITTRLLAGHLAGIRHYANQNEFLSSVPYESVSESLNIFADDPVLFPPGTEFGYSTYGYNLISAVLESVSGENFVDYMARNVFGPAGMESTVPDRVYPLIRHRSRYYSMRDSEIVNAPWVDNSNKWAGGGFLSTSDDLVRFGQAHLSDTLLSRQTIDLMWRSQKTSAGEETGYGIGWFIAKDKAKRRIIRHSGGSIGGTTELRIYPDHDLIVVVITNTAPANVQPLANDISRHFLSRLSR